MVIVTFRPIFMAVTALELRSERWRYTVKTPLTLALLAIATPASAALSRTTIPTSGGFVQAGASPIGQSFFTTPGNDFEALYDDATDDFSEGFFSGVGSVARSASATTANSNSTGFGQVSMGQLRFTCNSTSPNAGFANGLGHGGFRENFVVNGGAPGTQAWMLVDIAVTGSMSASGFAGAANFNIAAFVDDNELRSDEPGWDNGNSDPISTDRQRAIWGVSTSFVGDSDSRVISDMITFAVPITIGETFNFGIYGYAVAGKRSSSGVAGSSSSGIDFGNTITWEGARIVDANGSLISGTSIGSDTGLDWESRVPAPGTASLALAGLLASTRRKRKN